MKNICIPFVLMFITHRKNIRTPPQSIPIGSGSIDRRFLFVRLVGWLAIHVKHLHKMQNAFLNIFESNFDMAQKKIPIENGVLPKNYYQNAFWLSFPCGLYSNQYCEIIFVKNHYIWKKNRQIREKIISAKTSTNEEYIYIGWVL